MSWQGWSPFFFHPSICGEEPEHPACSGSRRAIILLSYSLRKWSIHLKGSFAFQCCCVESQINNKVWPSSAKVETWLLAQFLSDKEQDFDVPFSSVASHCSMQAVSGSSSDWEYQWASWVMLGDMELDFKRWRVNICEVSAACSINL